MQKELEIKGKKVIVRELLAREVDEIDFTNSKEAIKKQVLFSTNMTEEEYNSITWSDRRQIIEAINEVNGLLSKPTS